MVTVCFRWTLKSLSTDRKPRTADCGECPGVSSKHATLPSGSSGLGELGGEHGGCEDASEMHCRASASTCQNNERQTSDYFATQATNFFSHTEAMPWLRRLVASLSLRRPGFDPGSVHVGFMMEKLALGQVFL
jgi:hypothetical protein